MIEMMRVNAATWFLPSTPIAEPLGVPPGIMPPVVVNAYGRKDVVIEKDKNCDAVQLFMPVVFRVRWWEAVGSRKDAKRQG